MTTKRKPVLPVAPRGEQTDAERAVEEAKGSRPRTLSRVEVHAKAAKVLAEATAALNRGARVVDEHGAELATPDEVVAHALAGHAYRIEEAGADG